MNVHGLLNWNWTGFRVLRWVWVLGLGVFMAGCAAGQATLERQQVEAFTRESTWDVLDMRIDYLLYLPAGYDDPGRAGQRWPLIVYMHGVGENGGDATRIANVPGLPQAIEQGLDIPAIVVSPHNTGKFNDLWHTDAMLALIESLEQQYRIDPNRVYLTGISLGGYTAWSMASVNPERYAAIVPVAAWGYPAEIGRMAGVSVWAFHGSNDIIVPARFHRSLVDAHQTAGGDARWTLLEGRGHDAGRDVYTDMAMYEWLLSQRR